MYKMLSSLVETQAVDHISGHTITSMNRNVKRLILNLITMLFHVLFGEEKKNAKGKQGTLDGMLQPLKLKEFHRENVLDAIAKLVACGDEVWAYQSYVITVLTFNTETSPLNLQTMYGIRICLLQWGQTPWTKMCLVGMKSVNTFIINLLIGLRKWKRTYRWIVFTTMLPSLTPLCSWPQVKFQWHVMHGQLAWWRRGFWGWQGTGLKLLMESGCWD